MKLYYRKDQYVVDDTLYIGTWWNECGYFEPYGDVTVNLSGYGVKPEEGHIFMPTYKMTPEYFHQVCEDIVDEIVGEVQIGYGRGCYVRLKENWENNVEMLGGESC